MYTVVTSDFVTLVITCTGNESCHVERRFQKSITIDDLKGKLELLTGGNRSTMRLRVYDDNGRTICRPDEGDRLLGSYPIDDGMRLDVDDVIIPFGDGSDVEKFQLSEEKYSKRSDTLKVFMEKNKLGKYNEEDAKRKMDEKIQEAEAEEALIKTFNLNDRCEIKIPARPTRRATVAYIGKTDFKEGWWVGVKYDEPLGKNDGTVNGKRYFECPPKYGGFVKPAYVTVGDFPEEFDLNEEM